MGRIISACIKRWKTTLLLFIILIFGGWASYNMMPREADPDVPVHMITVDVTYYGISPKDSERLLVKPLEKKLKNIENVKEIDSTAIENGAHVVVKFHSNEDDSKAYRDVKDAVNKAKQNMPKSIDRPKIKRLSFSDRKPIINVIVSGDAPKTSLITIADQLKDKIESLKSVNRVNMTADTKEEIEILISPQKLKTYNLDQNQIISIVAANNNLAPIGKIVNSNGQYTITMPGDLKKIEDVYNMPIKVNGNKVITFKDIAKIRRVRKDPEQLAFFNNKSAVGLAVVKTTQSNIIKAVNEVKKIGNEYEKKLPSTIKISYSENQSKRTTTMISGLQNNILSSILLVLIVVIAALGIRSAFLVGLAIPGSFLMGMIVVNLLGFTVNIVVLFALIMSVGMLVDGAIVVTEYADMKLAEGCGKFEAYMESVERMAWPIIASTVTTLISFIPLAFWPGLTGEIIKYLPITVVCTLTASLFMALIFVPTVGALIGKKRNLSEYAKNNVKNIEEGNFEKVKGYENWYYRLLKNALKSPVITIFFVCFISAVIMHSYIASNPKKLFFPVVTQRGVDVIVRSKDDLSIYQKKDLVLKVQNEIMKDKKVMNDVKSTYTTVGVNRDEIGDIRLRYTDWQTRRDGMLITDDLKDYLKGKVNGVKVEVREEKGGPSQGKKLQMNLYGKTKEDLYNNIPKVMNALNNLGYLKELDDNRPVNGLEWKLEVNREKAAKYGASVYAISNYIQMITHGLKIGEFRPDDLDHSIDIEVRYPSKMRNLNSLNNLMIKTKRGEVPISYFVTKKLVPKTEAITRVNGKETIQIHANTKEGVDINSKINQIKNVIAKATGNNGSVWVKFKGDIERQQEAANFLKNAFLVVLVMMYFVLILQFDKYSQGFIILSAVVFAAIGSFWFLQLTGQTFDVVMGGVGIVSLAGIVVNNNIVLIDTYNYKVDVEKKEHFTAIIETGVQRLRPVMLTTITTILGLVPMALQLNINLFAGSLTWNSPASYWWSPLSMMVIGGLIFSTIITLILTPCLLICLKKEYWVVEKIKEKINYFKNPT